MKSCWDSRRVFFFSCSFSGIPGGVLCGIHPWLRSCFFSRICRWVSSMSSTNSYLTFLLSLFLESSYGFFLEPSSRGTSEHLPGVSRESPRSTSCVNLQKNNRVRPVQIVQIEYVWPRTVAISATFLHTTCAVIQSDNSKWSPRATGSRIVPFQQTESSGRRGPLH